MESGLDISEFQIKLRSRSDETFAWLDRLSPVIEMLEPELEVIIDQAWNLHGYTEKNHIYLSICLRSGLAMFDSYTSSIAVSEILISQGSKTRGLKKSFTAGRCLSHSQS
eukprot:6464366-Amphidinium_carterae.2